MYSFFVETSNINITDIKFRNKAHGWKQKHFSVSLIDSEKKALLFIESKKKNVYQKGFIKNIFLRFSCYNCPVRSFKSGSDITIGDYWGIENVLPEFDDDTGVSLVMVNTEKGKHFYDSLDKQDLETTYHEAFAGNHPIEKSVLLSQKREVFFKKWRNEPVIPLINKLIADPLHIKLKKILANLLRYFGLLSLIKSFYKTIKER